MITNNSLEPLHIALDWIMFIFIIWLIMGAIQYWNDIQLEVKLYQNYKRIFNNNRIIPIKENIDTIVAVFRRELAIIRRNRG